MDIFDNIRKLASDAVDLTLQKMKAERIGAEAARRGLFEGYLRTVPNETLTAMKRERGGVFVGITDAELMAEFAKRGLRDVTSHDDGVNEARVEAMGARQDEAARVKALAVEIVERARKLYGRAV